MSFFADLHEAERYSRSRPYFHPLAIARAKETMGIEGTVPLAVDVACGTGQSSTALISVAERVIGFDISRNMLANAKRNERVRYVQARAESMPFQSDSVPFMSSALAFHWFDRDQFLREAGRVLSGSGLLLIYNNGFTGNMKEDPAFHNWSHKAYLERFPIPPRDSKPLAAKDAEGAGFAFIKEDVYENEVSFTLEGLVAYLTTQTNIMAAVEEGRERINTAKQWLRGQIRPFFADERATFVFRTRAWYLQKAAER